MRLKQTQKAAPKYVDICLSLFAHLVWLAIISLHIVSVSCCGIHLCKFLTHSIGWHFHRLPRWRGSCKVVPSWILYAGSVLADEVFMDPRRLFGGSSAAIEERERPQSPPQEELLCLPRKWLSLP